MIDIRKYLNKKGIYNENEIEKIEKFFNRNDIIKKRKKEETDHTFSKMEKPIFFIFMFFIFVFYLTIITKFLEIPFLNNIYFLIFAVLIFIFYVFWAYKRVYIQKHLKLKEENKLYIYEEIGKIIDKNFTKLNDNEILNFKNILIEEKNFIFPLYKLKTIKNLNKIPKENLEIKNIFLKTEETSGKNRYSNSFYISSFYFPNYNLDLSSEIIIKNNLINDFKKNFLKYLLVFIMGLIFIIYFIHLLYVTLNEKIYFLFIILIFLAISFLIISIKRIFKIFFKNKKSGEYFDIFTENENLDFINNNFIEILKNFRKKMNANFMISKNTFYVGRKYSEFSLFYKKRTFEEIIMDYYIENKIIYDFAFEIENFYKINSKKEN